MVKGSCEACGEGFEGRSSRKRFCDRVGCKRKRARARKRSSRAGDVVDFPQGADVDETVEAATRAALAGAARLTTPAGRNALAVARQLDRASEDSGSSYAALSKQHLAALEKALEGAAALGDEIDELKARRDKKLAGAR